MALPRDNRADRPGNVGRREARSRDLVQQRLEQVVVLPIDEDDVGGRLAERVRREQAAEACADDDDFRLNGESAPAGPMAILPAAEFGSLPAYTARFTRGSFES
jgi:hypothetical protein